MLTKELLTANAALSGLTEEQISAITTLSQNDENSVIGSRIGEIYRQLDDTIAKSTGIARNGDEKTYLYLERAAKLMAEKAKGADALTKQVAELTKEKQALEKAIADGASDEETKKALSKAQKDLANVTKEYTKLQSDMTKIKEAHASEMLNMSIDNELNMAKGSLKFKQEFPKSVTDVIMSQAVAKVKGMNPAFIDNGKGGKVLAFMGEDGTPLRNSENQLNPYTAEELLRKELKDMGVLAEQRVQQGAGGKGGQPTNKTTTMDISGAKTRVEAVDIITNNLLQQGMVVGSKQFDEAMHAAYVDNNVKNLPER